MREYEITVVLQSKLDEEARNQLLERISEWISPGSEEGDKPVAHHWGQRTLAYPIKKNRDGYYVMFEARLETTRLNQMERDFLYEDDILRHLVVRKEQ